MKALTLQIQVKSVDIPNPLPSIKAAAAWTIRLIVAAFNALLLILGILGVAFMIIMIINPNLAGTIVAEVLHQMYVWGTS